MSRETIEIERVTCDRCGKSEDLRESISPLCAWSLPAGWLTLAVGGSAGPEVELCRTCNERHSLFMRNESVAPSPSKNE